MIRLKGIQGNASWIYGKSVRTMGLFYLQYSIEFTSSVGTSHTFTPHEKWHRRPPSPPLPRSCLGDHAPSDGPRWGSFSY